MRRPNGRDEMKLALVLLIPVVLALAAPVEAQLTCRPRFDGGYSCFDGQGNGTTSTPRFDGGFNIYESRQCLDREAAP